MNRLQLANLIAQACHHGQFDKGGVPRFYHAQHVAQSLCEELHQVVGYLHDCIEDSPLTSIEALTEIFGIEVGNAVDAISRRKDELYFDYIDRVKANRIARAVKLQDLKHNMDRTRWPEMPKSYYERELKALKILQYEPAECCDE